MTDNALDVLAERGLVEQVSDAGGLRRALQKPVSCYVGFDPSAPSLHIGHLVPIMAMAHMQRHGHRPIAVVGGGTGMVGDPSGRNEMRQLLSVAQIDANMAHLKDQMARLLDFAEGRALVVNNADWLRPLNHLEFLRDVGRHFSVNRMLAAETYRQRYEAEGGLNFLEFSYILLQAYDFLRLYRDYGCLVQMGGNDQWSNILGGVDLIRRVEGVEAYALTFPLFATSTGAKMGKSVRGAVWIDPTRVSPFEYYQFWINREDERIARYLAMFTFLTMDEVRELSGSSEDGVRHAKQVLAFEATKILHGEEAARGAQEASQQLFGRGQAGDAVPFSEIDGAQLAVGIPAPELFTLAGLAKSRSEARRLIEQGGAAINDVPVTSVEAAITSADLVAGQLVLRAGKKRFHRLVAR